MNEPIIQLPFPPDVAQRIAEARHQARADPKFKHTQEFIDFTREYGDYMLNATYSKAWCELNRTGGQA
jgi:N-formylglutamate amidohydrolase